MTVEAILLRRAILDWQDQCLFDAEITLTRLLRDLEPLVVEELDKATLLALTLRHKALCAEVVDPLVARRKEPTLLGLQNRAQTALNAVRAMPFAVKLDEARSDSRHDLIATAVDLGSVGAPVAIGIWAVMAAPAASVGTVAVWMGLGTAATFSLPILLGGAGLAAAAGSFGLFRLSGIKQRSAGRHKAQIMASVAASLLGDGKEGVASALSAFSAEVERIADGVLQGINDDANLSV